MAFGKPAVASEALGIGIGDSWAIGMIVGFVGADKVGKCVAAAAVDIVDDCQKAVVVPAVFVFVAGTTDR